jgi:hypothetical protein
MLLQEPLGHRLWFLSSECKPGHKVNTTLSLFLGHTMSNVTQEMMQLCLAASTQTVPWVTLGS